VVVMNDAERQRIEDFARAATKHDEMVMEMTAPKKLTWKNWVGFYCLSVMVIGALLSIWHMFTSSTWEQIGWFAVTDLSCAAFITLVLLYLRKRAARQSEGVV